MAPEHGVKNEREKEKRREEIRIRVRGFRSLDGVKEGQSYISKLNSNTDIGELNLTG